MISIRISTYKRTCPRFSMTTRNERLLEEIILFLDGQIKSYEDEKDINDMLIANMDFPYNSIKRKNIAEYSTKLKEKILLYYQGINEF